MTDISEDYTIAECEIEDLAIALCHGSGKCSTCTLVNENKRRKCSAFKYARRAYEAGYRKNAVHE